VIEGELSAHAEELASRPTVLVGNKVDVPGAWEASARVSAYARERERPYFAVSAVTGEGMDAFIQAVGGMVHALRVEAAAPGAEHEVVYEYARPEDEDLRVERTGAHAFEVFGRHVLRMVVMTDMNNEEAVAHLQMRLRRAGVEAALTQAGAAIGDEVTIGPVSFDFEPEDA
jgi:GTP-binding protein